MQSIFNYINLKTVLMLITSIILVACAKPNSDDEWASGVPDSSQGEGSQGGGDNNSELPAEPPTEPIPTPNEPVDPLVFFSVGIIRTQLANGPALTWNGCEPSAIIRGGYDSDSTCGKAYLHPSFADHLNKHFFSCIEKASSDANLPRPESMFIRHIGTYNNRNSRGSTTLSLHAYAKGIDLAKFILFNANGSTTVINNTMKNYSGANGAFYDSFRQCWKDSLPATCKPGQREYQGSIGHPNSAMGGNSLHTGHIHLTFPPCAGE
jgi:hypothetical protein